MKPQEGELVNEISKLQGMVSELKTGFTSALLELSQIQHGDTYLREELEENRRSCQKKARRMEGLVESLKEELVVMRSQIQTLGTNRQKRQQDVKGSTSKQKESDPGGAAGGRSQCECSSGSPASPSRGRVLLHCYLQGLKAGLSEGTDARHQVAMQLLHSEWEYVSTLNQLYDKYRTPPVLQVNLEPYQTYLQFVEQLLQRHLIFRNTLQERLSAEHWKSLIGDILVQLIGQNDVSFTDMYLGYTTTLAAFLSLEFSRIKQSERTHKKQSGQEEREELHLLSLLLAPVSRIHSYLSHIQSLLQWTGKEHPDCSLLLGTEKALRSLLTRCHLILEEDVRWDEEEAAGQSSCSGAPLTCASSAKCSGARSQRCRATARETQPLREEACVAAQRDDQQQPVHLTNGCLTPMHLQCWSRSPVRRKSCMKERAVAACLQSAHDCGLYHHGDGRSGLLTPEPRGWGENSDSGRGTSSQPVGKGGTASEAETPRTGLSPDDCETDPDDTSAFDYSSVTSCSPDGTLRTAVTGSNTGEEEDEDEEEEEEEDEDSEVPVLLKPSYTQQQRDTPRERTVCLRWQIPRLTPHPPRNPTAGLRVEAPTPCLVGSSYGKRLVSIKKGSPQLHPKSAFRPIWDEPATQGDAAPEKESRQGFLPVQATGGRQTFQKLSQSRENLRPGPSHHRPGGLATGAVWEDSEDSEGPCSTV